MLFLSFILNLLATLCRRLEGINTVPNQTLLLVVIENMLFCLHLIVGWEEVAHSTQ